MRHLRCFSSTARAISTLLVVSAAIAAAPMYSPIIDRAVVEGYAEYPSCCDIAKVPSLFDLSFLAEATGKPIEQLDSLR
jgi:hypothetical protein